MNKEKENKQQQDMIRSKRSADAVSVVQTLWTQEEKLLSKEEALACVEHLAGYVAGIQTQIKPSELLKALADSIDVIHERVRKKPAVAMVAAYNKAMTALMPVIPGPCFVHFDLEMCFAPQGRTLLRHLNVKKWSEPGVLCTF